MKLGDLVIVNDECLNADIVGWVGLVVYFDSQEIFPTRVRLKDGAYHFTNHRCLEVINKL
jgi:hypothetical protein